MPLTILGAPLGEGLVRLGDGGIEGVADEGETLGARREGQRGLAGEILFYNPEADTKEQEAKDGERHYVE